MSVMAGIEFDTDLDRLANLDFHIEEPCEIPERARFAGGGMPKCPGRPAVWVGWRENCCPQSPRYLLLCDECKRTYQEWMIRAGYITCANCHKEGGYVAFTELNRKS